MDVKNEEAHWRAQYLYLGCKRVTGGWTQLITVPILLSPAPCPGQVTPSPSLTQTTGHTQTGDTPGYVAKSFLSKSYFYDPLQIGECMYSLMCGQ